MVINFENLSARPNFASKDFQKYFSSKDFNAQEIFFWIFVKIEKVLEKILACNGVLKIQICSRKKFQKSREANLVEN